MHVNTKYGRDIASAICNGNGAHDTLAILGVMIEVDGSDNKKLEALFESKTSL